MKGAPPTIGVDDRRRLEGEKSRLRREVWDSLQAKGVARFPFPPHDRIPNFEGSKEAAERLAAAPEFQRARVVKSNPDAPQLPFRTLVLREGKSLVMAVPRLREPACFRIFPEGTHVVPTIEVAMRQGRPLVPEEVPHVDLVMAGSVAVGPRGERVGKGGGFSDLEWGLLSAVDKVDASTVVATTVHDLQLRTSMLPVLPHDVPLDLASTPSRLLRPPKSLGRPRGILSEELTDATRAQVDWLPRWMAAQTRKR
ncbi:MAG: 5-formyltetrahydrofolate cyclo-ligase [Euryarchaeota archaeon]|nr:5-formyltetrahydrofolate cyclo-ligase [Euryarchaeota archaeon]MDE1835059.1 5-formyltetrahydrofolate cyclo-ligase [Euryarchaeota archaeon]MDE1879330.1 5-formyltetrahydrofolate cyclo-ligase [Euryarchaeota archaeon]MDE2044898.1 5-formyltetrahydrofolate cyclo-ligase [Thermoplasmata archaeon]